MAFNVDPNSVSSSPDKKPVKCNFYLALELTEIAQAFTNSFIYVYIHIVLHITYYISSNDQAFSFFEHKVIHMLSDKLFEVSFGWWFVFSFSFREITTIDNNLRY